MNFYVWQEFVLYSLLWFVLLFIFRRRGMSWEEARSRRSLLFALLASGVGPYLLIHLRHWPREALIDAKPQALRAFAVAAAHWFVSFLEEVVLNSKKNLAAGAETSTYFIHFNTEELGLLVKIGYVFHHALSCFIYVYALVTNKLSGPCIFGLIYEWPVVFQHIRELNRITTQNKSSPNQRFWIAWLVAFFLARPAPSFVYFFSLVFAPWRRTLYKVLGRGTAAIFIYHTTASAFTYLNFSYAMLLMSWYDADFFVDHHAASFDNHALQLESSPCHHNITTADALVNLGRRHTSSSSSCDASTTSTSTTAAHHHHHHVHNIKVLI
mmetsp:Transcript_12808/g.19212  ORF Transcript_12808/g.19212 Transcript_12808/m.19212 type:complete len:325 (-) Transcript_12808:162-1136(-)